MTKLNKNLVSLLVICGALFATAAPLALEERWFRVELLIFSNESPAARTSEVWEPTPLLAYPDRRRFLIDQAAVEENITQFNASSMVDDFGYQTLTVIAPPEDEVPTGDIIQPGQLPPPDSLSQKAEQVTAEAPGAAKPTPFTLLPRSELEFGGKAAYMQRTGHYQTLFHGSWLQPFADQKSAIPIIIDRSGDSEDWPRLQGSIKLYLSRYLHIQTNLWLNTDGSYLPSQWQMPAPPLGPKSISIIYPPGPELEILEPEVPPENILELQADDEIFAEDEIVDTEAEPPGPIYPWRHAVLLQQKRRMRSTEVHYIDHPMLGIIIKISPITDEELEQRAMAEAELAQEAVP